MNDWTHISINTERDSGTICVQLCEIHGEEGLYLSFPNWIDQQYPSYSLYIRVPIFGDTSGKPTSHWWTFKCNGVHDYMRHSIFFDSSWVNYQDIDFERIYQNLVIEKELLDG